MRAYSCRPLTGPGEAGRQAELHIVLLAPMNQAWKMEEKSILELADRHGLNLDPASLEANEMGLDYRVIIASTDSGDRWVLRIPRRAGLIEQAAVEAKVLKLVKPALTPAVPDWQIHSPDLIAYPLLPGAPGLTLDSSGSPVFHIDMSSHTYAESMGDLVYELHSISTDQASAAGVPTRSPDEVRSHWRSSIDKVAAEFTIDSALKARWSAWLDDDSYWPTWSVLTHGELYPAHTLVENDKITAVLDWTTAEVADPARDFVFFQSAAPPEVFERMVQRYIERGGRFWPRLKDHCVELMTLSPVSYGLYALETGEDDHRAAAQEALKPTAEE